MPSSESVSGVQFSFGTTLLPIPLAIAIPVLTFSISSSVKPAIFCDRLDIFLSIPSSDNVGGDSVLFWNRVLCASPPYQKSTGTKLVLVEFQSLF